MQEARAALVLHDARPTSRRVALLEFANPVQLELSTEPSAVQYERTICRMSA